MNADDFQDLYKLLRGSKSAMPVLDAKALYSDRKMIAALEKLIYARDTFLESRSRILNQDVEKQVDKKAKDADRQIKKLKRKQDKLLDISKAFEELIEPLEKLAERQRERESKAEKAAELEAETRRQQEWVATLNDQVARPSDVSDGFLQSFSNASEDDRLDLVASAFGFVEVQTDDELIEGSLYLIRTGDRSYLVCTPSQDEMESTVKVTDVISGRPIKPFSREEFLKLGQRRKMVLLTRSEQAEDQPAVADEPDIASEPQLAGEPQLADEPQLAGERERNDGQQAMEIDPPSADDSTDQNVLDMGAFSQLLTSAQRSGLVPAADQIGYVRDREFRKGLYDQAFQSINGMHRQFVAAASQRTQRLTREDAEISSGRVKISPKELQAKRSRDRMQTQEVERANRRFQVVLEGLRVLMNQSDAVSSS